MAELSKYLGLWYIAGFIGTLITVLVVLATGNFVEITTELTLTALLESLPLPLSLLVGWYINPLALVVELVLQSLIFTGILFLSNR